MKTPHPARSCSGIALNGCGLFVLPFLVGGAASLFFESSEVVETGDAMLILALIFILPPLVVQMMGVFIKVARERLFLKEAGRLTTGETLASIHRHMRIVTPRGWIALDELCRGLPLEVVFAADLDDGIQHVRTLAGESQQPAGHPTNQVAAAAARWRRRLQRAAEPLRHRKRSTPRGAWASASPRSRRRAPQESPRSHSESLAWLRSPARRALS